MCLSTVFCLELQTVTRTSISLESPVFVFGVVHCSVTKSCQTLWPQGQFHQLPPSSAISWSLLKFMSIELGLLSNHLILYRPLLLPSNFLSIRIFSNESTPPIRWPRYWNFSFSISPSNEYSVLISFSIDWFDLLAVQGTLKNLLQHHSLKASILQHSTFFMSQLSYLSMTTSKWGEVCSPSGTALLLKTKLRFLSTVQVY